MKQAVSGEDNLDDNKAVLAAIRRARKDLVEQMVSSQKTMDEAREMITQLDVMLEKLQPN